jgi:hypothetical protein
MGKALPPSPAWGSEVASERRNVRRVFGNYRARMG